VKKPAESLKPFAEQDPRQAENQDTQEPVPCYFLNRSYSRIKIQVNAVTHQSTAITEQQNLENTLTRLLQCGFHLFTMQLPMPKQRRHSKRLKDIPETPENTVAEKEIRKSFTFSPSPPFSNPQPYYIQSNTYSSTSQASEGNHYG